MSLAYLTAAAATLLKLAIPMLLGATVDQILSSGDQGRLFFFAGSILLVSILGGAVSYGQTFLSEAVSQRAAFDLRNDIFKTLHRMSFDFYDRYQTGNLMSRATGDVDAVRDFTSRGVLTVKTIVFTFGTVSYFMLATDLRLGLITLSVVPLVTGFAITMRRRMTDLWVKVHAETADMTTILQENIAGAQAVKAMGGQKYELRRFDGIAESVADDTYTTNSISISRRSLIMFVFTALTGVILLTGGTEAAAGGITPGELTTFVLYIGLLLSPVMGVSGLVKTFTRAYAAGARLYEILDAEPQVKDNRLANPLGDVRGAVTFENVSFSYGDGPVLQNIDLTLDPGKTVAILGSTGSGKSSLVHLVPRFYDPTEGRVLIDGQDLREVRLSSVRENIGIVLQDVFVFSGTISENISYGHPSASFEDIEHAAKIAHLHDDIMESHLDYDTIVGERGVTLSGGQRQRLAIARTVLMDPPILILDDSTSSVDTMTEEKIQQALADLMKNRTTFVIAHRLSTIRDADSVIVLDQGRIVEHGTHDDLSTQNGHYRRIYDLQFGGHLVEEASMLVGAGGSHK